MTAQEWKAKGRYIKVGGKNVFVITKQTGKPVLAFLHGYPSASYDYYKVLPLIEKWYDYIIHDHLGFGFSDKSAHYSYSLIEQAETALNCWSQCGLVEVHVAAHDYGTTIANEIIVRKQQGYEPVKIKSITFSNGSMHIGLAHLKLVQKLLKHPVWGKYVVKLMNELTFQKNMRDLWFDKKRFDSTEIKTLWNLLTQDMSEKVLHRISSYNNERILFSERWMTALSHIDFPVHILWGRRDPVAVEAIADALHSQIKNAVLTKLENCGHYPMLEQPELWSTALLRFIDNSEQTNK